MTISLLADMPQAITVLVPDLLAHWRFISPEDTLAARDARLRTHLNRDVLPIAWVAHRGDEVWGTASLRVHDLDERVDLTPWLGGVFVRPAFRHRGVASALCRTVEIKARALGYPHLFLFTLDQQSLYRRLGFHRTEAVSWRGRDCALMSKDLTGG